MLRRISVPKVGALGDVAEGGLLSALRVIPKRHIAASPKTPTFGVPPRHRPTAFEENASHCTAFGMTALGNITLILLKSSENLSAYTPFH